MTPEQLATLKAHILANTNSDVVAALASGNMGILADWYNSASATKAWRTEVTKKDLFGALNLTSYDGLTAGKRDTFRLMYDDAPVDFTVDKIRAGIIDIFSVVDETAMLTMATEFASQIEALFGGTSTTSGAVTAIKRVYHGPVSYYEIADALRS